uniref:NADH dehydrogenase [ubiquinone] 1 alpha subcomplex subunit 3 n=1 Tax=Suricata suricatta TaxID=37032 RepID=A0A673UN00_SURSU
MAARCTAFLKNVWASAVMSFTTGGLAIILPPFSPHSNHTIMINQINQCPSDMMGMYPSCQSSQGLLGPSLECNKKK